MRFGADSDGEVYVVSKTNDRVYRFVAGGLIGPPSIVGDLDLDGDVDTDDALMFKTGWLSRYPLASVESWMHGDLNLDATTNLEDLFLMHQALQNAGLSHSLESLTKVPEPNTLVLLALLVVASESCCSIRPTVDA